MRSFLVAVAGLLLFAGHAAQAKVDITVDQSAQMMTVAVDGVPRYHWPVSTGIPSRATPDGNFRAFRMEASHFSKEFDDAPMPHSIFFTKVGHAIHGTESEGRLGTPASHGCVRLSRANAATLYALVEQQGVLNTTVTLTGSAAIAIARNPRRANTAVAQRDPAAQPDQQQYAATDNQPQYAATSGEPMQLTPQPQMYPGQRVMPPQQRPDDGYIYPADGSSADQRYPAPRDMNRPLYNAQAYQQQQQQYQQQQYQRQYYNNPGYAPPPPPQGYYQQQRQYYPPAPRGYYDQN
jgi:L,D-transpeptidase catalytic domain